MGQASSRLVKTCHTPPVRSRQAIEYANDFQKHSEQNATGAKPLIGKAVSQPSHQSTVVPSTKKDGARA
jgi:hypothetical protein